MRPVGNPQFSASQADHAWGATKQLYLAELTKRGRSPFSQSQIDLPFVERCGNRAADIQTYTFEYIVGGKSVKTVSSEDDPAPPGDLFLRHPLTRSAQSLEYRFMLGQRKSHYKVPVNTTYSAESVVYSTGTFRSASHSVVIRFPSKKNLRSGCQSTKSPLRFVTLG